MFWAERIVVVLVYESGWVARNSPHPLPSCLSSTCSSQGVDAQRHYPGLKIGTCTTTCTINHRRTDHALTQVLIAPPIPLCTTLAAGRSETLPMVLHIPTPAPSATPSHLYQMIRCERRFPYLSHPSVSRTVSSHHKKTHV